MRALACERTLALACAIAQTLLGLALALCEDGPMAGISIYFFVQRYQIPVFQVRCPCAFIRSLLRPCMGSSFQPHTM